ncbi:MAG: HAMP domain-containing protein, partial [Burkholderiales bacterium]|nr:HAMP domain-containing protein [Burkholderiales bacterium]
MNLRHLSLGAKLWTFVAAVMVLLLFTLAYTTNRSTELQKRTDSAAQSLAQRTALAMEWRAQVEVQTTRILAMSSTADPAVAALFKTKIPATSTAITGIQKQIEATGLSATEQQLFAKVAEERKAALASLAKITQFQSSGDQASAVAETNSQLQPLVEKYLGTLNEFNDLQQKNYQTLMEGVQSERNVNMWITRSLVLTLLLALMIGTQILIRQIRRPLKEAIAVAETIASGDLRAKVPTDRADEFGTMMKALDHMKDQLVHLVSDVRRGTDSMAQVSEEISSGNNDLSNRTEQTASNLQRTAASMEHLTTTVRASADSARQANQLAASAAQVAQRGGDVVGQVVHTMGAINDSSRRIADIISVIDGIAFQTNILALNAAVEAARAGEQGRGFAVVAGEVRALAGRSAQAAKEIKDLIGSSVEKVAEGSTLV